MAGELEAVITAVDQLPDDTDQVPDAVLVERMQHLVQARAMLDAALACQLQAFDARAAARYDGQTSTLAWTRSRLRLGTDAAALLRVARQLDQLPHLSTSFQAGELTLEHATAVARLIDTVGADPVHDYEPILLDLARQAPPKALRTACEHLRQLLDPGGDADEAARQRRHRRLTAARTLDHMVHLEGLLDPQSGDIVLAALEAAMPVPAEYEPRTTEQRRADALTDIAAGWLASNDPPTSGGLRPQVTVTVSLRQLQAEPAVPKPTVPTGASFSSVTYRPAPTGGPSRWPTPAAWPATPASSPPCSAPTARYWTSGASPGWCRPGSAEP